jgi:hypothetical protein
MTCGLELNPIPKAVGDQKVTAFLPYISGGIYPKALIKKGCPKNTLKGQ